MLDVIEQQRPVADASGLIREFNPDGGIWQVTTDGARVTQILANLVGNAVK